MRRWWWPLQLRALAFAVAALLLIAAVALAAAGVFSPGRPVTPVSVPNPRTFSGAVIPSTIRALAVRAQDPAGDPSWGLRLVRTTRGEVCITPGRVQGGVVGVLGRDQAFGDDERLHPYARDYIDPFSCALPDAQGHAFLSIGQVGLPASALIPELAARAGGCRVDNPRPANSALLCPTSVLRDVYYGLLGPDAVSVTYRGTSGHLTTKPTAGPSGAYLIVLPYTGGLQGTASIGNDLSGSPVLTVHYRDGYTCSTAHGHACQPIGYHATHATHLIAAQVRTPVSVRVVRASSYCSPRRSGRVIPCAKRVPRGFSRITHGASFVLVDVSFIARVPVTNSRSYYEASLSYAKKPGCTVGGLDEPTNADIHAGRRVLMQDFHPLTCPGPVHGVVRYVQGSASASLGLPGSPRASSILVGRFAIDPTAPQASSR
jgi:hypothetical protein